MHRNVILNLSATTHINQYYLNSVILTVFVDMFTTLLEMNMYVIRKQKRDISQNKKIRNTTKIFIRKQIKLHTFFSESITNSNRPSNYH